VGLPVLLLILWVGPRDATSRDERKLAI